MVAETPAVTVISPKVKLPTVVRALRLSTLIVGRTVIGC